VLVREDVRVHVCARVFLGVCVSGVRMCMGVCLCVFVFISVDMRVCARAHVFV